MLKISKGGELFKTAACCARVLHKSLHENTSANHGQEDRKSELCLIAGSSSAGAGMGCGVLLL